MICPICNASISDDSSTCPACGADLSPRPASTQPDFIFCEGCGARLGDQDRTCPKCGRPARASSERVRRLRLAAGRTASFPRLTAEMIAARCRAPLRAPPPRDEQATSVLDAATSFPPRRRPASRSAAPRPRPVVSDDDLARGDDAYAKARRPRWVAPLAAVLLLGAVGVFVATDPLGVMPGIVESFDRAASEMYPSRQVAEKGSASDSAPETGETGAGEADGAHVLSEPEAFQLLSAVYAEITSYQDALGPVIETFNGQYLIKDFDQRSQASQGAYDLRSTIQQTLDELDSLRLTESTAYAEDVEHLKQLATWMYNRVDVLCKSWDISLAVPQGERPADHQDEILAPLREVSMVDGRAVDVIEYEKNVAAWKPVEK
ncbi:MAG: double zinc ribbon domain-containing protein [Collinsella intestinalis]